MTIINIGSRQHKIRDYILGLTGINAHFDGGVLVGKPVKVATGGVSLFFLLDTNTEKVGDDSVGTIRKEGIFEFYICANKKDTPDTKLFESLDVLSNAIVTQANSPKISLDGFEISSIREGIQSGILRDNENPYIIARYHFVYKYLY